MEFRKNVTSEVKDPLILHKIQQGCFPRAYESVFPECESTFKMCFRKQSSRGQRNIAIR